MNPDSQLQLVKQQFSAAGDYAAEYQMNLPISHLFNARMQRVFELMGNFRAGRVLDIGCGPAVIGTKFVDQPIEYYGLDVSQEMIMECISRFGHDSRFRFSLGRIEELPFPDSSFDVVLCLGVMEYVTDGLVAVSEITRVVKPRGIVIATMLNGVSPYRMWQQFVYWKLKNGLSKLKRLTGRIKNTSGPSNPTTMLYPEPAFRHLLTSNGLDIEDVVYYDFNLFFPPLDARFPRLSVCLSRKLEFLSRSKLKFLGTGYIVKSRKSENHGPT